MLMFQNGLLATFIPELFMVIGFVLCLFTPGFRAEHSGNSQAPIAAQVYTYEHQNSTTYQHSTYSFQISAEPVSAAEYSFPHFIEKTIIISGQSGFSTSDGLSFVDFSRPPPAFLS